MQKSGSIIKIMLFILCVLSGNSILVAQTTEAKPDPTAIDMVQAGKSIESIIKQFSEDFKNGDSLALAAYYAKDGTRGSIKGKDLISAWGKMIRNGIKEGTPNLIFTTNSLSSDGEFLAEWGTYESKDNQGNVKSSGKYLVVWKQEEGEWKMYRDIGL